MSGRMSSFRVLSPRPCGGGHGAGVGERAVSEGFEGPVPPSPNPQRGSAEKRDAGRPTTDPAVGALALSLLNAIGEGVCLGTRSGEVVWGNELFARLGGAMHERIGGACRQFDRAHPMPPASMGPGVRPLIVHTVSVFSEDDRAYEVDVSPVAPEIAVGLLAVGAERSDYLIITVRDVSAARRLQHKIDAIDIAGSELLRFDAEVVRKHNAHERLKLLESRIVRVARELLHFDHFAIRLLDEKTGRLELVIGCGLPPDYDSFDLRPALEGQGITGFVAASGRSYVCTDTAKDDMYLPGVEGAKSSLTIPLRLHEKVIGVMNVESLGSAAFGEEERQLAEIFARYVAMAIHMLDLLVVERSTTNQSVSGRVEGELDEPLQDIAHELDMLIARCQPGDATTAHVNRIRRDVEDIRKRVRECAAGPTTLLGVEQALAEKTKDPLLAGKRVLVADDEPKVRRIIGDVLRNRGCELVTQVENGARAIEAIQKGGAFDLIVSDIRMPDRNGYEVFAAARKLLPGVPVILMTGFGYDPHHSIVRASQEGLQSVLFKPFQVERLLDEVRKAVGSRKPA